MYPDFIGIGAQKAGTTWLHRNLQRHPQIWMPKKEVHYFDRKINDNSNAIKRLIGKRESDSQWRRQVRHWTVRHTIRNPSLRDLLWDFKYYMRAYNDEWYASLFKGRKGRVAGEITPAYSVLRQSEIAHVHSIMPQAKIIFMIRNPIERVWSHAMMNFDKVGKSSVESVSQEELLKKLERNSTRLLTDYLRTLENWASFYPEEQIFVGFLEDVHFAPASLLQGLYRFLDVDPSVESSFVNKKVHTRSEGRMPTRMAAHVAQDYYEEIKRLHERFGGYAGFWLYCADRLVGDPPEEEFLTYPLYESVLWEGWVSQLDSPLGEDFRQIQSGPLAFTSASG